MSTYLWDITLESKTDSENKYFMLANLNTMEGRYCGVEVLNLSTYQNLRLLEVEGHSIDETFTNSLTKIIGLEAGEGNLFQVAPVVKYGGNLIADEIISAPTTLTEDMTIENGATLYVNSEYMADGNITVKSGGKIIGGNNSSLVFTQGHQLTVDGNAELYGSVNNRLQLIFPNSHGAGMVVKPTASLNISFCEIQNARYGIVTESHTGSINIDNVNFVHCTDYGIVLLGSSRRKPDDQEVIVRNCSIENSSTAIHATNYGEIIV